MAATSSSGMIAKKSLFVIIGLLCSLVFSESGCRCDVCSGTAPPEGNPRTRFLLPLVSRKAVRRALLCCLGGVAPPVGGVLRSSFICSSKGMGHSAACVWFRVPARTLARRLL